MPQKILLIDDSKAIHTLVKTVLWNEAVELTYCPGGESTLATALSLQPDLILLDVGLPHPNGFELCRRLKSDLKTLAIPIVFLTGATTVNERIRGWELGAVDYITKPFEATEFLVRVRTALRTKHLIDLLARKAMIDGLTGLYNRSHFEQRLESEISLARADNHPLSCILLDVDNFKHLNDQHGHLFGDEVLRSLSKLLIEGCRDQDIVCRYGGEEFSILLPNVSAGDAIELAERLRVMIAERPIRLLNAEVSITCSFGVAQALATGVGIIEQADKALYRAKSAGRNRVLAAAIEHVAA